jgi:hypothetical protein
VALRRFAARVPGLASGLALAVRRAHPPTLTGRAVAALAADPHAIARTGHALNVTDIAMEHGIPGEDRPVSFGLLRICEFGDGRISRGNVWMDLAAVLGQLGAITARPWAGRAPARALGPQAIPVGQCCKNTRPASSSRLCTQTFGRRS